MKVIIAIFFLLPLAITDRNEDLILDPQHDKTEHQIKTFFNMVQTFDELLIGNVFDEWISPNSTSETPEMPSAITPSGNITFSKFPTHEDIMRPSDIAYVTCMFGKALHVRFKPRFQELYALVTEGTIKLSNSGSFPSCQIRFGYNITQRVILAIFENQNEVKLDFYRNPFFLQETYNFEVKISRIQKITSKKVCENIEISTSQHPSLRADLSAAVKKLAIERFKISKSANQTIISNECLHSRGVIYIGTEDKLGDYVRFEPDGNMAAFPWISDHNELVIRGLNHFRTLYYHNYSDYNYNFNLFDVEIRWNIVSLLPQQCKTQLPDVFIGLNSSNLMNDFFVNFGTVFEMTCSQDSTPGIKEQQKLKKLKKLVANGIKETYLKSIRVTEDFTDTINKILRPFDENTFENLFVDFELTAEKIFLSNTISFSKIETEDFSLGNVTCAAKNLNVITLEYKKIRGHVEYWHSVETRSGYHVQVSATVNIEDVIIHILLKAHPNTSNEIIIQIDDNLNRTDITIEIESKNNRLRREDRTTVGTDIFKYFVDALRKKISNVANATFYPIFNVCQNSWDSSVETHSNHSNNRNRYFAVISDYWMNETNPMSIRKIELTIEGSWNFQPINLRNMNESIIIDGLRIENVTGSIILKQIDDSDEIQVMKYTMSYISLIIKHADMNIWVEVPDPSEYYIVSIIPNISLTTENKVQVIENFQSTVASYIEQSIYNDSNYRDTSFQEAREKFTSIVQEERLEYDASFTFTTWLVKSVLTEQRIINSSNFYGRTDEFSTEGYNFSTSIELGRQLIQEEICDRSNHLKNEHINCTQQVIFNGTVHIVVNTGISAEILFVARRNCTSDTSITARNDELQFDIDRKNIRMNKEKTNPYQNDSIDIMNLEQLTVSYLKSKPLDYYFYKPIFCISYFATLDLSEEHFYLIKNTITYSPGSILAYYIKLYGLHNLQLFRNNVTPGDKKFDLMITNVTAHVIWIQNIVGIPSKMPKKIILRIDEISLIGETTASKIRPRFNFSNNSRVELSNRKNSSIVEKLRETLAPIILKSIQSSIRTRYYEFLNADP